MKKIGIKFCGGCNPRYDRKKILNEIKNIFKDSFDISTAREGEEYDFLVIIAGCRNSCADYSKIDYKQIVILDKEIDSEQIGQLFSLKK